MIHQGRNRIAVPTDGNELRVIGRFVHLLGHCRWSTTDAIELQSLRMAMNCVQNETLHAIHVFIGGIREIIEPYRACPFAMLLDYDRCNGGYDSRAPWWEEWSTSSWPAMQKRVSRFSV